MGRGRSEENSGVEESGELMNKVEHVGESGMESKVRVGGREGRRRTEKSSGRK